jgi:hypothetical protein
MAFRKYESTTIDLLRDYALPLTAVLVTTIALAIGWQMFARRMNHRTIDAEGSSTEVSRIWGGPLVQPQPRLGWRRSDAATVELSTGELATSTVNIALDAQYRRRGITEYPAYLADFAADYSFRNPSPHPIFVAFNIGLPVDRASLMVTDLALLVDGAEDASHTSYAAEGIAWNGELAGGKDVIFSVKYRARGLERLSYALGSSAVSMGPVNKFELNMTVRGVPGQIDYPVGAMSPTDKVEIEGGQVLTWKVDNLLSSFDVGVVLPDRSGLTRALHKLINNAPFYYLFYALALLYAFAKVGTRARTLHLFALSGGYFLYFPLATYLTGYVAWPLACTLALAGISALAIAHAMRFVSIASALWVALAQIFFLAVPAAAYLLPAHTGIILVLAGFLALALAMHVLGRAAKKLSEAEDEDEEAPQPALSGART